MATPKRFKRDLDQTLLTRARAMRKDLTPAEKLLWNVLREQWQGLRWRRQEPLHGYIVDFVCFELKLVIEVDGLRHEAQTDYDEKRDAILNAAGFHVVRVTNHGLADPNSTAFGKISDGIAYCKGLQDAPDS